jgi:hypothetical protein
MLLEAHSQHIARGIVSILQGGKVSMLPTNSLSNSNSNSKYFIHEEGQSLILLQGLMTILSLYFIHLQYIGIQQMNM